MARVPESTERSLGKLEASVVALGERVTALIFTIERIEAERKAERDKMDLELADARRRIYERIEREAGHNEQAFKTINETISTFNAHMLRFDMASDAQESQAQAILEMEKRIKVQEDLSKDRAVSIRTNRRWIKGIIALCGILESWHLGGDKILKWLGGFSK